MKSPQFVQDIIHETYGSHLEVGMVTKHPDGRTVKIMEGQFLDPTYGRLSNFWYWQEVLSDGSLSSKKENGYGWSPSEINKADKPDK